MANGQVARRTIPLTGWLIKRKRDNAPSRLLRSSNRRYFTIDFESQVFYYAHSEHDKSISLPLPFQSIRGVAGTGPCFFEDEISEEHSAVTTASIQQQSSSIDALMYGKRAVEQYGFIVRTPGKLLELASETKAEAQMWMEAFREAMAVATSSAGTGIKIEHDDALHIAEASTRASTAQTVSTSSSAFVGIAPSNGNPKTAARDKLHPFTHIFRRSSKGGPRKNGVVAQPETEQAEEEDPFMRSLSSMGWGNFMGQSQERQLRSGAMASRCDAPMQPLEAVRTAAWSINEETVSSADAVDKFCKKLPEASTALLETKQGPPILPHSPNIIESMRTCWKENHDEVMARRYGDKGEGLSIKERLSKMEFSDDEDADSTLSCAQDEKVVAKMAQAYEETANRACSAPNTTVVDKVCEISIAPDKQL
mmetsp:Transcript_69613/g.110344  ORF Transcript_69613/g.110344 Transcript_69613/m.110344 type:complete len:423 (+) Transcript_69613:76-1344(+)